MNKHFETAGRKYRLLTDTAEMRAPKGWMNAFSAYDAHQAEVRAIETAALNAAKGS